MYKESVYQDSTIVLVSPQNWSTRRVSKHHYARALANYSTVYFVNPPIFCLSNRIITIRNIEKNLNVVDIFIPMPRVFKFHLNKAYSIIVNVAFRLLKKRVGNIDILWNFDNANYFRQVDLFLNSIKILHLVDDFVSLEGYKYHKYDIGFAVSESLMNKLPLSERHFINHGVSDEYLRRVDLVKTNNSINNVLYLGNLSLKYIDTAVISDLIASNKDVEFNFVGDYDEHTSFIDYLIESENVVMLGRKEGEELIGEIQRADVCIICYRVMDGYMGDNSHKLLEYLSQGKLVLSSILSTYADSDLLIMSKYLDNRDFIALFEKIKQDFSKYNSPQSVLEREQFARSNSYNCQLDRIESYLLKINE